MYTTGRSSLSTCEFLILAKLWILDSVRYGNRGFIDERHRHRYEVWGVENSRCISLPCK